MKTYRFTLIALAAGLVASTGIAGLAQAQAVEMETITLRSITPQPGFLADEGGYYRIVQVPKRSPETELVRQVSPTAEPGFLADEGGYVRYTEVAPREPETVTVRLRSTVARPGFLADEGGYVAMVTLPTEDVNQALAELR